MKKYKYDISIRQLTIHSFPFCINAHLADVDNLKLPI